MKIAIRDDDTSFYTNPQDLKKAHEILGDIPISLSVVPFTVKDHTGNKPYGDIGDEYPKYVGIDKNEELVEFLKEKVKEGKYEILLHGINHEYKKIDGEWVPEMLFKDKEELIEKVKEGKDYLNKTFDTDIKVFVAPSNAIDKNGIIAIENSNLNFSGIIRHRDRPLSFKYCISYIKRWSYRAFTGLQYGGVLYYGKHDEIIAYPVNRFEQLLKEYYGCKKHNHPFVIFTHYWEILRNKDERDAVKKIIDIAIKEGAEPVLLSECFK